MEEVNILHLEDDAVDAELIREFIQSAGIICQIHRVVTQGEFEAALRTEKIDIILADYRLPTYDGLSALRLAQKLGPDIPFIFVSGTLGEEAAIEGLTQGATDYVLKQKQSRLPSAIKRALSDAENRRQRIQAEQALRESEERFRRLAENAEDIICRFQSIPEFRLEYVNPAVKKILGYTPEELYADPMFLLNLLCPEDQQLVREALSGNVNLERFYVLRWIHRNGSVVWTEQRIIPIFDEAGNIVMVEGIARDITERKNAEATMHLQSTALEAAANGIVITDRNGTILWVNRSVTQLSGYTAEEAIGQNPRMFKSGKQSLAFYQKLWNTITSGQVWHDEVTNRRKDGTLYTEEMTIAPVRTSQGEISHFIAIKQDVTERKQHDQEREAIITISNALRTAPTRAEMLPVLLDQLNDLFHADGAMLAMRDPITGETLIEFGRGVVGASFTGRRTPPTQGVSGFVIASGKPYRNNNVLNDSRFAFPELLGGARAAASVPLIAQEQPFGALWIVRKTDISEGEMRLLMAIADIAANAIHRVTLHEQTEQRLQRLTALHQIDLTISTSLDLGLTLNVLLSNVVAQLGVDAADVLLFNPYSQILEYGASHGFRTPNIEHSKVRFGSGQAGIAAMERRVVAAPDLDTGGVFDRKWLLIGEGFVSHFAAPLIARGQVKGVLEVFHRTRLDPQSEWLSFLEMVATQTAIAIDNTMLFRDLQHSNMDLELAYDATIEGWSRALDLRDKETEGHTQRVTELTLRLARMIGMNNPDLIHVRRGALLHDIGKMGIPDDILLKPGPLTEEEWKIMHLHPIYAFNLLSPVAYLRPALDIPYCHHEKWDGTGYPRKLKGEQIPLAARVFAVVDVWDALRNTRPYRKSWPERQVVQYIQDEAGKHFDLNIAEKFLHMVDEGELMD